MQRLKVSFVSLRNNVSRKNTKDNHQSTFVNFRLPVTLFPKDATDIEACWFFIFYDFL